MTEPVHVQSRQFSPDGRFWWDGRLWVALETGGSPGSARRSRARGCVVAILVILMLMALFAVNGFVDFAGRPNCSAAPVAARSDSGGDGLPKGPVTRSDIESHQEATLAPPGAATVDHRASQECDFGPSFYIVPTLGGTARAFTTTDLKLTATETQVRDFYNQWLLARGWRHDTAISTGSYSRGSREKFTYTTACAGPCTAPGQQRTVETFYVIEPASPKVIIHLSGG